MKPALAWAGCGALGVLDGIGLISEMPRGVWHRKIDEHWEIYFNGHDKPRRAREADSEPLPPYGVYVVFNGFPAGILLPSGGVIAAGSAANEDSFIAAIEKELGCSIDTFLSGGN